jgi:hypothetical protein
MRDAKIGCMTKTRMISARFATADADELDRLAAEAGVTRSEALRRALYRDGPLVASEGIGMVLGASCFPARRTQDPEPVRSRAS